MISEKIIPNSMDVIASVLFSGTFNYTQKGVLFKSINIITVFVILGKMNTTINLTLNNVSIFDAVGRNIILLLQV